MKQPKLLALVATAILACAPLAAMAQAWPAKPITYVVPFTPGGTTDVVGRTISHGLATALGQPVIVDNKPGAAGAIAARLVAKANPDGYTLLGGTISTHAINAGLYKNLGYDPVKDFEPISLVGFIPNALYVNAQLPVRTVQELIALLKKDAAARTFASPGAGSSTHLAGELFADLIGVPLTHVPYKGQPQALQDVAAGQVAFLFDQLTAGMPLVKAGKLRLLAVTTAKRIAAVPDAPTMDEAGVKGFEMAAWQAVYAPKGTPKAVVDRLNKEIVAMVKSPEVREKMAATGIEVVGSTPEELTKFMQKEIPRWAALVQKSGAQVD
ncbi:tripartite tricarboxylate transporter substrate binding protein [Ramlibacter sp. WS9]|uniref:Bug family tripartite tricarboxylate transporter substrate binding protein n=1 Tax=Ramlibacter sp. WS9 TaxID=1882741 RepID=UPI001144EDF8|nr:tripartite tricarboxylate transporter substrate binding protein [Ramlibacter sp. WS9]ROZ78841.1 tripartite tricarboxylate transporter substrate binding protein [Ramlibacter sp. WS9]